jgi:hypothetical protein
MRDSEVTQIFVAITTSSRTTPIFLNIIPSDLGLAFHLLFGCFKVVEFVCECSLDDLFVNSVVSLAEVDHLSEDY